MLKLKKDGITLPWPSNMQDWAESQGWGTEPEEVPEQEPVLQSIAIPEDVVEITLPEGTKETPSVLKTPVWRGAERWFTKSKLVSYRHDGIGWVIQIPMKDLKQRKLECLMEEAE